MLTAKRILLTGFEPFGGETRNPSLEIARAVAERAMTGSDVCALAVPVTFRDSAPVVLEALRRGPFDALVMLGQAGGRSAVTVERIAINMDDASIPDNAGDRPVDRVIEPDGPAAFFATLPVRAIVEAVRAANVPAAISNSAGTYVCNHLMYSALYALQGTGIPAGFIHVPYLPEQAQEKKNAPSLPLDDMIRAIEAALSVL